MGKKAQLDLWIAIPYVVLSLLGVVMVYSSSVNIGGVNLATAALHKQIFYVLLGFGVASSGYAIKLQVLRSWRVLLSFAAVVTVMLVLVLLVGGTVNGAKSWLTIGPINIQPEEFLKLFIIIFFANYLSSHLALNQQHYWHHVKPALILLFIQGLLVLAQPETGGFAINMSCILIMVLASGQWRRAPSLIISGLFAMYIVMIVVLDHVNVHSTFWLHHYQLQRFAAFVDPFGTRRTIGNQLVNSYLAVSNGGLFGCGLGAGIQKQGYLPEPNTDFILAVISEELGAVAVLIILIILGMLVGHLIRLGNRSSTLFERCFCFGLGTWITVQTLFNAGGVIGALPITGVTLPFISYGGSSTLALAGGIGIALNISRHYRLKSGNTKW